MNEQRWRQCVMIRAELTHLDEIYISAFHRIALHPIGEERRGECKVALTTEYKVSKQNLHRFDSSLYDNMEIQ